MGVSGRDILETLIGGEDDPEPLLILVRRGVKAPAGEECTRPSRAASPNDIASCCACICARSTRSTPPSPEIDEEVNRELDPFQQAVRQLRTIPGDQ